MKNTQVQRNILRTWIMLVIKQQHLVQTGQMDGPIDILGNTCLDEMTALPARTFHEMSQLADRRQYRVTSLIRTPPPFPQDHHRALGVCYCRFLGGDYFL